MLCNFQLQKETIVYCVIFQKSFLDLDSVTILLNLVISWDHCKILS